MKNLFTIFTGFLFVVGLSCPAMAINRWNSSDTNYLYLYSEGGVFGSVYNLSYDFTNWTIVEQTANSISVTGIHLPGDSNDGYMGAVARQYFGLIRFNGPEEAGANEYYAEVLYLDDGSVGSIYGGLWGENYSFSDYQSFIDSGVVPEAFSSQILASVTPVPGAVWLLGSGLAGLVGIRRKMKA